MVLHISKTLLAQLRDEAARTAPRECCGLLLGSSDTIEAIRPGRNVHPTPETHFEIDPQLLVDMHRAARAGGARIAGYYHSHPSGPARPSAIDQAMAHGDGMIWAIVGRDETTFWRDVAGGFQPLRTR